MDYIEALEKLNTLTRFGINLGLQRITSLLRLFAHPEEQIPIIHLGGTNGKGSTLAMLSSILREAGYRVGTFTSPHLLSYRERFMINGTEISAVRLTELLEEILAVVSEVQQETGENPTEFEILTALAFLYFAREKVDVALIEVGMGGDIDSTNVVKKPLLSIVTNVSLEHTAYLGTTLTEIARRKSGIIKQGCPVLTGSNNEEVLKVLRQRAAACQIPLYEAYYHAQWEAGEEKEYDGQVFTMKTAQRQYDDLFIPFLGQHQVENAVLAVMAAELLTERGWEKINSQVIRRGLAQTKWPGRLEVIGTKPLVVLDGAHNPAGMAALAHWLEHKRSNERKLKRVILVIGMLDDKDRSWAANLIKPLVDLVIITKPNSERAPAWEELGQYFGKETSGKENFGKESPVFLIKDLREALEKALQEATAQDLVLVTGSLYLIGEVKKLVQDKCLI